MRRPDECGKCGHDHDGAQACAVESCPSCARQPVALLRSLASNTEIYTARELHENDDVQIDDDALACRTDEGVWVQAWVWVNAEELKGKP